MAEAALGTRLTITAVVVRVVAAGSFVVRDADLTNDQLLVLTTQPNDLQPPDLVMVEGIVIRFLYRDHVDNFVLADRSAYRQYEGRKALAAHRVRSLAN